MEIFEGLGYIYCIYLGIMQGVRLHKQKLFEEEDYE